MAGDGREPSWWRQVGLPAKLIQPCVVFVALLEEDAQYGQVSILVGVHDVHFERILKTVDRVLRAFVEVKVLDGKLAGRIEGVRFGGQNAYIGDSERAIHLQPFTL